MVSEKLALFVWLEVGNLAGRFSENGFHLLQGKKEIIFHAFQAVEVKDITKNLVITSLSRIYNLSLRMSDLKIIIDELK